MQIDESGKEQMDYTNVTLASKSIKLDYHSWNQDLQGLCKIKAAQFLRLSSAKLVLLPLGVLLTGGLLLILLYNYVLVQRHVLFVGCEKEEAQSVLILSQDEQWQLETVVSTYGVEYFQFRGLPYRLDLQVIQPWQNLVSIPNSHSFYFPSYPRYLVDYCVKVTFIYLVALVVIYYIDKNYLTCVTLVVSSLLTLTVNYVLSYIGYLKLRKLSQLSYQVSTGESIKLNHELRFKDRWVPQVGEIVPCDCLLLEGTLFVDESNLTGESVPIFKQAAFGSNVEEKNKVFEGSKIVSCDQCECLVVLTGFMTRKGRILRELLVPKEEGAYFFKQAFILQGVVAAVMLAVYFASFKALANYTAYEVVSSAKDIFAGILPPFLLTLYNYYFSVSVLKLYMNDIVTIYQSATLNAGMVKTVCFDKTGTLTSRLVQFESKRIFQQGSFCKTDSLSELEGMAYASCHTCVQQDQLLGDHLETEMFRLSGFQFNGRKFQKGGKILTTMQVYQFKSDLKRMSVVVNDSETGKSYLFCKGAPEVLLKLGRQQEADFQEKYLAILKEQSCSGLRSIAYWFKELDYYSEEGRLIMERDLQFISIVSFNNQLQAEAKDTISTLLKSNFCCTMITGDDQYVAAAVGQQCGILTSQFAYFNQEERPEESDLVVDCKQLSKLSSEDYLRVKVFARANPEQKAQIVRKIRAAWEQQLQSPNYYGVKDHFKVAMVGDGANDILAINSAEVGIGLSNCESSLSSSFSVGGLWSVVTIIREGQATINNMVDVTSYNLLNNCLVTMNNLMFLHFKARFMDYSLFWLNFIIWVPYMLILPFTRGVQPLSSFRSRDILLTPRNLLNFFGHLALYSAAQVYSFLFGARFYSQFGSDPRSPISFTTPANRLAFTQHLFRSMWIPYTLITGEPFKKSLYTNRIFVVLNLFHNITSVLIVTLPTDNWFYSFVNNDFRPPPSVLYAIVFGNLAAFALCMLLKAAIGYCIPYHRF